MLFFGAAASAYRLPLFSEEVDGTITLNSLTGLIDITITSPARFAGTYTDIDPADLAAGPVNLVPVAVSGTPEEGEELTATPGLWIYDEDNGPIAITRTWDRGGVPIEDEDGLAYTVTTEDEEDGLRHVETAEDSAGDRSITIDLIITFVEAGVVFDGTNDYLRRVADLDSADRAETLYFASMDWTEGASNRQLIISLNDSTQGLAFWNSAARNIRMQVLRVGATAATVTGSRSMPGDGTRIHILGILKSTGAWAIYSYIVGTDTAWNLDGSGTIGSYTASDLTTGVWGVGCNDPGNATPANRNRRLIATVYRIAMWAGATVYDITASEAARNLFLDSAETGIADPEVVNATVGTPLIDVYGEAADYNATSPNLANKGSAGELVPFGAFVDA
jgi:hypothetical protein